MIVVAFAVNILMGGGEVTKAHFDERINEINARIDSVQGRRCQGVECCTKRSKHRQHQGGSAHT